MRFKKWSASLLTAAMAVTGLTIGAGVANAAPAGVDDATLEWGYSKYAQSGVMSRGP